jgi:hypothetical protein
MFIANERARKLAVSFGVALAASWVILGVASLLSVGNGKKIE